MAIYMVFLSRGRHYGFSFIRGDEPGSVASGTPSDLSPIVLEIKEAFAMILFCGTLIGFFWISILVLAGFFS